MKIEEMIERAHQNARDKGFWAVEDIRERCEGEWSWEYGDLRDAAVCQKLALIATEVREFEEAAAEPLGHTLEELADTCIRIFDLCGYLVDVPLNQNILDDSGERWQLYSNSELAETIYSEIAAATIAHRQGHMIVMSACFDTAIEAARDYAREMFGEGALLREVERKMRVNESREHMHGRRY